MIQYSIFDQLKELKHIKFFDNNNFNDFDWGSYERIARLIVIKLFFYELSQSQLLLKIIGLKLC